MNILRTASLGSNSTGSYKKENVKFEHCDTLKVDLWSYDETIEWISAKRNTQEEGGQKSAILNEHTLWIAPWVISNSVHVDRKPFRCYRNTNNTELKKSDFEKSKIMLKAPSWLICDLHYIKIGELHRGLL